MSQVSFEIRCCESCGLRYPLVEGHPFGTRCPVCMGSTQVILHRQLVTEPGPTRPLGRYAVPKSDKAIPINKSNPVIGFRDGWGGALAVLLDNIRSAWNVGSILRSADGFGFTHAYLCGITPTADNESVTKTSLGAEDSVPWSYHKDAVKLVKGLKTQSWKIYALEDDERAFEIMEAPRLIDMHAQKVLIVGSEVTGVDPELLDLCDAILYIPMRGEKKSFNVAIAFSIAAYTLTTHILER